MLCGLTRQRSITPLHHVHQPEFESVSYTTAALLARDRFAAFVEGLHPIVYRAKGFVRFATGPSLFNWEVSVILDI